MLVKSTLSACLGSYRGDGRHQERVAANASGFVDGAKHARRYWMKRKAAGVLYRCTPFAQTSIRASNKSNAMRKAESNRESYQAQLVLGPNSGGRRADAKSAQYKGCLDLFRRSPPDMQIGQRQREHAVCEALRDLTRVLQSSSSAMPCRRAVI